MAIDAQSKFVAFKTKPIFSRKFAGTVQYVKFLPATNLLGFDSHRVKECVVFQSRSLADILISARISKFIISTLVCPALKGYGSFNVNIGGVWFLTSI